MSRPNKPPIPTLYLWLCNEGWMRFGPFQWIGLTQENRVYADEQGQPIIYCSPYDNSWRPADCTDENFRGHSPMITSSRKHPAPMQGEFPTQSDIDPGSDCS